MKIVKQVNYNFAPAGQEYDYQIFNTFSIPHDGMKGNCKQIIYHEPQGNGDRHYCDVWLKDGSMTRIFNINELFYDEVE